jgi:hypothetical protein
MGLQKFDKIDGSLSMMIDTFGDARIVMPDRRGMNDFNIDGKVELSVAKGTRKVIFKGWGKTKSVVRRKSEGYNWWNLLAEGFSKVLDPLPRASRP